MDFIEERVVGPSLGAENVERGTKAVMYSFLFALAFFLVYYRMFGLITCLALLLNLLMVVAVMSVFGATMTLPGFAGLALVHRHVGGRQRADQRTNTRRVAGWRAAAGGHRHRL